MIDFYALFFLLGGVAVMLIGMTMMGNGLEKFAGSKMKTMLGKATTNRFAGVGVGTAVTCVIQSSTATTVMLVGFVNIGLMTLAQAANVIMGANIGTTVTAWLVSLAGVGSIDVGAIAAFIGFAGIMMTIFFKNQKVVNIGNILVGLGLIFVGLEFMSNNATDLMFVDGDKTNPQSWATAIFGGQHFPLLLVLIGIVITALVHSSSTITSLMVVLASIGVLSFENALFLALGSNIGTCVTALMSSAGANTNAKRTAVFHLLFNCIGCVIFIAPIWIWQNEIADLLASWFTDVGQQIALFHTAFNLVSTALLLPFVNYIVKFIEKIIPDKKGDEEESLCKLNFIDPRIMETPRIALDNTKKEIVRMAGIAKTNIALAMDMLITGNLEQAETLEQNEEVLNFLNKNITDFMTKLSNNDLNIEDEKKIGSYYHVVTDIERVGDYAENIMEYSNKLKEEKLELSDSAKEELRAMTENVDVLFEVSIDAFNNRTLDLLPKVDEVEELIDKAHDDLEVKHIERLKQNMCTAQVGSIFLQTISNLERVGDHITNVAFSIKKYLEK